MNGNRREIYARGAIESWLANRVAVKTNGLCEKCDEKDAVIGWLLDPQEDSRNQT